MKNKGLMYLLLAGGVILLLSMKKGKGYKIEVPKPQKISKEEFEKKSLIQKISKVVKKAAPVVKKLVQKKDSKRSSVTGVGQFPDMC